MAKQIIEIKFWEKANPSNFCFYPVTEKTTEDMVKKQADLQHEMMGRDEMKMVIK
jgi:hypothetical protein